MAQILKLYNDNQNWINLIKDIVYFSGVYVLIKYIVNWNFIRKTGAIETNLRFRERIETVLAGYVIQKNKNGIKDIGIRFVYWKNYPRKLANDGYKHLLRVEYDNNQLLGSSWIDNTGIYFQEHLWFSGYSVYMDTNGIFFFAPEKQVYKGFKEYRDKCLVMHMPFTSIINFDFREIIEYDPVFYIKYPYTKYKKLYSRQYIVREKLGDSYSMIELDSKKKMSKYSWGVYKQLQFKIDGITRIKKALAFLPRLFIVANGFPPSRE